MSKSESAAASRAIAWLQDSRVGRWLWYQHALTVYSFGLQPSHAARSPARVEKDSWTDLQCYRKVPGQPTRDAFLAMSRQRLAAGEHAYTICEQGELLAWAWMVPNQRRSWFPAVRQEVLYPDRSCVLYGAFTTPAARGRGLNGALAHARLADAVGSYGAAYVFTAISTANEAAIVAKKGIQLTPWLELSCRVRFGRQEVARRVLIDVVGGQPKLDDG
jgi:hypothetical protein